VHHRLVGQRVLAGARRLLFTTRDYGSTSYAAGLAQRPTSGELPNGVDVERFAPTVSGVEVRRRWGIPEQDVLVLFVGSLDRAHYFKGLRVLLAAMKHMGAAAPRLLVVGDGDLRAAHERHRTQLSLSERVHFAGRVADDDLPRYYAAADLVVLPSVTRGEAFGVVLLEAMASGTPVVASDLPGVRAVVQATGGGLLVPPRDTAALAAAIADLAGDPVRRAALGRAGRAAVEANYAWPAIGRLLDTMYRAVLETRDRPLVQPGPVGHWQ
ncbi:MAG: glycosyltransferase family 4 protein, partial [Chloroflexota bacterium]|nr:glycosyltransferase family 4 protein [Chloroflexota bacterium]